MFLAFFNSVGTLGQPRSVSLVLGDLLALALGLLQAGGLEVLQGLEVQEGLEVQVLVLVLALFLGLHLALGLLGLLQVEVLLAELAGEVLPELGVWLNSRTKLAPRFRRPQKHHLVASTSRGPSSCELLERAQGPLLPLHPFHPRACRHALQELLSPRCTSTSRC